MTAKEETAHFNRLIEQHQKNIFHLEEMLAMHGVEKPLHLLNSLTIERESLSKAQQRLRQQLSKTDDVDISLSTDNAIVSNLPRRSHFVGRLVERDDILLSLKRDSRTYLTDVTQP